MKFNIVLLIGLCFSSISFSAPISPFSYQDEVINPACLAVFNSSMDDKSWIRSVSLEGCQHSTPTSKTTHKDNKGRLFFYKNNQNTDDGAYYYEYVGQATNGLYIVHSYNSDKRKEILIDDVLFLRIKPGVSYEYKGSGAPFKETSPTINLIGYLSGGDRCSGGIESIHLAGNKLNIVSYFDHQEPDDCKEKRSFTIDLSHL